MVRLGHSAALRAALPRADERRSTRPSHPQGCGCADCEEWLACQVTASDEGWI
jgi:hypothetical protein